MEEELTTALARLLGMAPAEARRDAENLEDTGPLWMCRELMRELRNCAWETIDDISSILTEIRRRSGWESPRPIELLVDAIERARIKRTEELLAEMRSVKAACDEHIPEAGPAYKHVWRECYHAVVQRRKAREIIDLIERNLAEIQESGDPVMAAEAELVLAKVKEQLVKYRVRIDAVQEQIIQLAA